LQIDIITLFPDIFFGPFSESIVARAIESGVVSINAVNLRDFTKDKRKTVDDTPYGGGPGMLMKPEPLFEAIEKLKTEETFTILTSPQGEMLNQDIVRELSKEKHLLIVCGHYEGVDERVNERLIDKEISIGDYVLTSGNLPAMVIVDSVVRLLPGALGDDSSSEDESFNKSLLEYPQYTKPMEFRGLKVPNVLLSGNHKLIKEWRENQAVLKTRKMRPDLYERYLKNKN